MRIIDMGKSVLIVEDDPEIVKLVSLYLKRDGHNVMTANNGSDGLRLVRESKPDLVILDLMLPQLDGMEICRVLREEGSKVPIIMLTALVQEENLLQGFDLGADDYIPKPFSPKELSARVRAVLRRTSRESEEEVQGKFEHGDISIDTQSRTVHLGPNIITLTPTEFRLLVMFMRKPGRVLTRENIIDDAFGYDFDGFDRTVDVHVSNIRNKFGADSGGNNYIQTVHGVGYKLRNE
jgi:DNA-binding response OmpR family regulator